MENIENEFNPIRPENSQKPKSKVKAIILLAVIILAVTGSILYYTWPKGAGDDNTPPSLDLGSSTYKGATIKDIPGFKKVIKTDVDNWDKNNKSQSLKTLYGAETELKKGIHYFYIPEEVSSTPSTKYDLTISELFSQIKPVEGNQLLFAMWSPGETNLAKGWWVYPGPFTSNDPNSPINTITNPNEFTIPNYRSFALVSVNADTVLYGPNDEKKSADKFPKPIKNSEKGWVQLALPAAANAKSALDPYKDRILLIYVMDKENNFVKVASLDDISKSTGFSIVWLKLKERVSAS